MHKKTSLTCLCNTNILSDLKSQVFFPILNRFILFNVQIKFPIYFTLHMCIAWQIMDIIPEWFHVFVQDCAVNKHENDLFVSLHNSISFYDFSEIDIIQMGKKFHAEVNIELESKSSRLGKKGYVMKNILCLSTFRQIFIQIIFCFILILDKYSLLVPWF